MLTTNPLYGGLMIETDAWLVDYDAVTNDATVEPQNHTQAWTRVLTGSPAITASNGTLQVVTETATGIKYTYSLPTLDTWTGCYAEAVVRVNASVSGADYGAMFALECGDGAVAVMLRDDGLNLWDMPHVAVDMTQWRRVRVALQGADTCLWVDGKFVHQSSLSYLTDRKQAVFGALAGDGPVDVTWRYMRARMMWGDEAIQEEAMATIGPYYIVIQDLAAAADGSSFTTVSVDHTAEGVFTHCQYPEFTLDDGRVLADIGVLVEVLGDSGNSSFNAKVTNLSYTGDEGYGTAAPDIILRWYRTGLIAP
jgi:hypothetical protein